MRTSDFHTKCKLGKMFFGLLAENPTCEHKIMARRMYEFLDVEGYYLNDTDCINLGVARIGIDLEDTSYGETALYPEHAGYNTASILPADHPRAKKAIQRGGW